MFAIKTAGLDANGIPMFWRDGKKISLQEFVGFRVEASDPWGLGIPEYFEYGPAMNVSQKDVRSYLTYAPRM